MRYDVPTAFVLLAAVLLASVLPAADWPQFRGPSRDGHSRETGLLPAWPEGGPRLAWAADGVGSGYSSPVVVGEAVFITGDAGDDLLLTAFDRGSGGRLWQRRVDAAWRGPYPGARSTVTVAGGRLFLLSAQGRVVAMDPSSGEEFWRVDILERFAGRNLRWGLSECLLVDGDRVVVTPGGDGAFLAALDAATGATVWSSPPLRFMRVSKTAGQAPEAAVDRAGYASPILVERGGRRLLATASARHLVVADAERGDLLWTREVPVRHDVIGAIPLWCEAGLVFSAPDVGTLLFEVTAGPDAVALRERWHHRLDNCHGALLWHDGAIIGSGYRLHRPWTRLDPASGAARYTLDGLASGAALVAEDRLYALGEKGTMLLLQPTADGFVTHGALPLPGSGSGDVWAHPALSGGHLFLRRHERLLCYDVRAGAAP